MVEFLFSFSFFFGLSALCSVVYNIFLLITRNRRNEAGFIEIAGSRFHDYHSTSMSFTVVKDHLDVFVI